MQCVQSVGDSLPGLPGGPGIPKDTIKTHSPKITQKSAPTPPGSRGRLPLREERTVSGFARVVRKFAPTPPGSRGRLPLQGERSVCGFAGGMNQSSLRMHARMRRAQARMSWGVRSPFSTAESSSSGKPVPIFRSFPARVSRQCSALVHQSVVIMPR